MATDKKNIVFNGGPFQSYWWADEHEPVHPAVTAELTDTIDPAVLEKAWERTKSVYPLLDCVPDDIDEEIIFFACEKPGIPIKSKSALKLAKEVTMYLGFSLTYFDNSITLSAYHSLADEKGLLEIFKTLLNFYIAFRTNTPVDCDGVMMKENRQPDEYFIQSTMLIPEDYSPQPVLLYRDISEIFTDTNAVNDGSCAVTAGKMEISASGLDRLCEESGAAPEECFVYALAKAVYEMYPDERRKLSFGIMTDFRGVFDAAETIAPCSRKMPLIVSRDDIIGSDWKAAVQNIAGIRARQKSSDYIKSHVSMENSYAVLDIRNACLSINFSGEFDIGEKTSCIKDITMTDHSIRSVFMIRLGDTVKVSFQYGGATDKYMQAVAAALNSFGADAKITAAAYAINAETEKPAV